MYFMKLAYQLKQAKGQSLDDLILKMVDLRIRSQPHGIQVWNLMLESEPGSSALADYNSMSNAIPIILLPDCLKVTENPNWRIERQDQEEFYFGFPEDCLYATPTIIKDLDLRSRAAKAGVLEGDHVTAQFSFFVIAERWGRKFAMMVRRDGEAELKMIIWSPRSREKVESSQLIQ
jgi:hypothetical protein